MRQSLEISVELTAQELLDQPDASGLVRIHDICRLKTMEVAGTPVNTALPQIGQDEFEIELTPEEIDALLSSAS